MTVTFTAHPLNPGDVVHVTMAIDPVCDEHYGSHDFTVNDTAMRVRRFWPGQGYTVETLDGNHSCFVHLSELIRAVQPR